MKFADLLTKYQLSPETVSVKLRQKIKQYYDLQKAIGEDKLKVIEMKNVKKKASMEKDIVEAEENLAELDEQLCVGIERYQKNIPHYRAQAEKLNKHRAPAKQEGGPVNDPPAGDPAEGGGATDPGADAGDPPAGDPPIETPVVEEHAAGGEVKKPTGFGWLAAGILFVAATIAGINYVQNRK